MYLGIIKLEANLTFYVNTHTPSTGAAVDADAVPGYRVYEDETGTPLLTGSMAKLDDANTTGFYSEQIAVTAANGFEAGKSYCIRITAVVSVTGVELHQFDVTTRDMDDLSTVTTAQVKTQADAALSDYDPSTKAEMDTAHASLATATALATHDGKLDTVDGIVDAILLDTGTDGVALSTAVKQAIADEVLKRGASNVEDAADTHSLTAIILAALESSIVDTLWTIRKTGGDTFDTKTVTLDAGAAPITAVT